MAWSTAKMRCALARELCTCASAGCTNWASSKSASGSRMTIAPFSGEI